MDKQKILHCLLQCVVSTIAFLVLDKLMNLGGVWSLLIAVIIGVGCLYYYSIKKKIKTINVLGYLSTMCFMISYIAIRVAFTPLIIEINKYFNLSSTQSGFFVSIFSATYGLAQIFAGYFLEKYGLLTTGIGAGVASLSAFGIGFLGSNYTYAVIFRALLGAACSLGSVGVMSFLSKNWPAEAFNMVSGLSSASAMLLSASIGSIFQSFINNKTFSWMGIHKILATLLMISSIFIFVVNSLKNKPNNQETKKEVAKISMSESIKTMKSFKYMMSLVWTSSCCVLMYIVHIFDQLLLLQYNCTANSASKAMAISAAVLILSLPNIVSQFPESVKYIYPGVSLLQILGLLLLFFRYNICYYSIIFAVVAFTICGFAHMIIPMVINNNHKKGDASFFFGVMNFGTMFFGCYGAQAIIGWLIDICSQGSVTANAVLKAIMYLGLPAGIITLISSFFVITYNQDNK